MKPGTPLPYRADQGSIYGPGGLADFVGSCTGPYVEAKANAEYLVHAANLYPELLTIARELVRWESDPSRYAGDLADLAQNARALLARCDGAQ